MLFVRFSLVADDNDLHRWHGREEGGNYSKPPVCLDFLAAARELRASTFPADP
jgi:hypothetical protein